MLGKNLRNDRRLALGWKPGEAQQQNARLYSTLTKHQLTKVGVPRDEQPRLGLCQRQDPIIRGAWIGLGDPEHIVSIGAEPRDDRGLDVLVGEKHSECPLARDGIGDVGAQGRGGEGERLPNRLFGEPRM
jgi:hypothetical protein